MSELGRIAVVMGGVSSEREVSLHSGEAVFEALKSVCPDVVAVDINRADEDYIKDLMLSYDGKIAFLALHGVFGEDGKIQKILSEINLPYTGSGPEASSLAMNKIASQNIFESGGLRVPRYCVLNRAQKKIKGLDSFPLVVKPACGGSSIGLSIADNHKELEDAITLAARYDKEVIVEEYIKGREMTVGIFDDRPLAAIEIKPKARFFDYNSKYKKGHTDYIVPAKISKDIMQRLKDTALIAHRLLNCSFFSRVDMILDGEGVPFVLEVNTIPGFTATSLLPMAAGLEGISFTELVLRICRAALGKREQSGKESECKVVSSK